MKCKTCGANLEKGTPFCPTCGTPQTKKSGQIGVLIALIAIAVCLAGVAAWLLLSPRGDRDTVSRSRKTDDSGVQETVDPDTDDTDDADDTDAPETVDPDTQQTVDSDTQTPSDSGNSTLEGVFTGPLFEEKLAELAAQYGVFNANQTGTMYEPNENWFDPSGIMGATIMDFDSDGSDEMLVCISEKCDHYNNGGFHIMLHMYEAENGEIVEADSILFGAYIQAEYLQTNQMEVTLWKSNWPEEIIAVNAVPANGRCNIVCENYRIARAFADGQEQSYWILEYADGKFRYVASFTQTDGGSAGFAYTGYDFEYGTCTNADVYYSEWPETPALYPNFGQAITEFFSAYNIKLNSTISGYSYASDGYNNPFQSILSSENNQTLILELINKMTSSDWSASVFEFSTTLRRGNDLLDEK